MVTLYGQFFLPPFYVAIRRCPDVYARAVPRVAPSRILRLRSCLTRFELTRCSVLLTQVWEKQMLLVRGLWPGSPRRTLTRCTRRRRHNISVSVAVKRVYISSSHLCVC